MFAPYKQYKARVAPLYQNEIDRHLFATASFHRSDPGSGPWHAWRLVWWLRRWLR